MGNNILYINKDTKLRKGDVHFQEIVKYLFIVDTEYTLSLYLLLYSKQQIDETLFVVGNVIPDDRLSQLRNVIKIDVISVIQQNVLGKCQFVNNIKIIKNQIRSVQIYALDHLFFAPIFIGTDSYVLLEDAPAIFSLYKNYKHFDVLGKWSVKRIIGSLLYGTTYERSLGRNRNCKKIMYTSPKDDSSSLLANVETERVDLKKLWNCATPEKKRFFCSVYALSKNDLELVKTYETILFSQPLMSDCGLTEEEYKSVFANYIEKYKNCGLVIKPHPRDTFDFEKHFPGVYVLRTKIPMQMLSAMGLVFKRAITVCSTAVSSLDDGCEIIWIGTKINPKIEQRYGNPKCP